ncbi:PHP domain-containing protein [Gracilimonas amylolytica]|uniref:PHP domain-containing protein n=1 Tax=Gracilimonas amylolytica TaxID=1749045 RepID=UPI000CD8792E|nr:PHP domain-containing protein [Gracilimonas amylolytica]
MLPKADLHIHTTCSDGKLAPTEVIELAKEKKLKAVSITDHDTYKGYHQAREKAEELEVELISGCEITSTINDKEAHILAYYFDPDTDYLEKFLSEQRKARSKRIKGIIATVQKAGVDVDYDEVWAEANGANIGRPHLARVLTQKGYVSSPKEAFIRYLSNQKLGTIENTYPDYREVIEIVKNVGGACVLAHPGRLYSSEEVKKFVEAGMDGIECIHPSHNYTLQKKYTEMCEDQGLLMTGGSDTHEGLNAGYTNLGVVTIAYKYVEKVKRMTSQRKNIIELKD